MKATVVLVALAIGTYACKSAGPLLLGGRELPARFARVIDYMPAAMLAALVVVSGVGDGRALVADARLVALGAAAVALWLRAPFVVVVVVAAAAAAAARALTG